MIVSCFKIADGDDLGTTLAMLPILMYFHRDIITEDNF